MVTAIYSKEEEADPSLIDWINLEGEKTFEALSISVKSKLVSSSGDLNQYQLQVQYGKEMVS